MAFTNNGLIKENKIMERIAKQVIELLNQFKNRGELDDYLVDDDETKWIVIPCDENGTVRSDIKIPSKDEIYAQIAFQEQFYSGVLVGI